MEYLRRSYVKAAKQILQKRAALAILGPRQCGKTTLAKDLLGLSSHYIDLERPSDFTKISSEPELFLREHPKLLIIDEAQRAPELFEVLRSEIDKRAFKGQFILLGSSSFQLIKAISESLSGRIGFLDLTPISSFELDQKTSFETHWLKGGFPDALIEGKSESLSFDWYEDYTRTLIERDLPSLGIELSPAQFRRLWTMCVHFHGQLINYNKMANSLDMSPHTAKRYLDVLEQTFMIRRLPPLFGNLKKRLIKSPKLYFRDSGMFHYFSRILNHEELWTHPLRGASFEGYVVEQLLSTIQIKTPYFETFFFRTTDDIEVDLILKKGSKLIPIEIKSSLAPNKDQLKSLYKFIKLKKIQRATVIGLGDDSYSLDDKVKIIGIKKWIKDGCPAFWEE